MFINKLKLVNLATDINSASFCPLPWIHQYIHQDGEVDLCSIAGSIGHSDAGPSIGSIRETTLTELWNSNYMKETRLQMLRGERPQGCLRCFMYEDLGYESDRKLFIRQFGKESVPALLSTNTDGSLSDHKLTYIDVRFSNKCDMACNMCNKESSSGFALEENKLNGTTFKPVVIAGNYRNHAYEELIKHYSTVKTIFFGGGDIFLHWEHRQILNDLIVSGKSKDITLKYITNGNTLSNKDDIFDIWQNFKSVLIMFSIDGYGEPGEYWRYGGKWDIIEQNIKRCDSYKNINTYIHSTLGWPNIFNWIEFMKYYFSSKLLKDTNSITGYCLEGPLEFSLQSAPPFKKQQIEQELVKLRDHIKQYKNNINAISLIDYAIRYMYDKDTEYGLVGLDKVLRRDAIRNNDFFSAFPEHEDMRPYF